MYTCEIVVYSQKYITMTKLEKDQCDAYTAVYTLSNGKIVIEFDNPKKDFDSIESERMAVFTLEDADGASIKIPVSKQDLLYIEDTILSVIRTCMTEVTELSEDLKKEG